MAWQLPPRIDRQLQEIHLRHAFAIELMGKIQRLRDCFLGNTLPSPSAKVTAAWNDFPNVTIGNLSVTRQPFLQTPSPTMGSAVDTDEATRGYPASNGGHDDDDDCLLVGDTASCTSDAMPTQDSACSATSEDDPVSRCSHHDQSSGWQTNEKGSLQSTDSNALPSDQESSLSSDGSSPTTMPVEFHNTVDQWLLDYRARGTDAFVESLIAFAVVSVGTALQASRIARAMVRKVSERSDTEGKNLESTVRFSALAAFKRYWESNDSSMDISPTQSNTAPPTPHGVNIASLMGSLFDEKMSTAKDVHLCLSLLCEGEKRYDRLCAMHALLVQANDKMCKRRNLPALLQFRDGITTKGRESGEYLWATAPYSKMVLVDILSLIERWTASQAAKREQSQIASCTGSRAIRNSAVGPRLRNAPPTSSQDCL